MFKLMIVLACAVSLAAQAQTPSQRLIRASGDATVSVKPDQAQIDIGVVTQAGTAQEASAQNATQVDAVLTQIRRVLGANADIQTIRYSISPNYRYPQDGQPQITGYTASNTVEATISDLSLIGRVIDAAAQAGANNIQGLRFSVKEDAPVRAQALTLATKEARLRAEAIAAGLNAKLGAVVSAQESAVARPLPVTLSLDNRAGSTPTPIETGLFTVQATVTVDFGIM